MNEQEKAEFEKLKVRVNAQADAIRDLYAELKELKARTLQHAQQSGALMLRAY